MAPARDVPEGTSTFNALCFFVKGSNRDSDCKQAGEGFSSSRVQSKYLRKLSDNWRHPDALPQGDTSTRVPRRPAVQDDDKFFARGFAGRSTRTPACMGVHSGDRSGSKEDGSSRRLTSFSSSHRACSILRGFDERGGITHGIAVHCNPNLYGGNCQEHESSRESGGQSFSGREARTVEGFSHGRLFGQRLGSHAHDPG